MSASPWFPALVDPTPQAVRRAIAGRVDAFVPEWLTRRGDDPGVALVKAFSEQASVLRRQLDRYRGQVVRSHLRLAGVTSVPVVPGRVRLEVTLDEEADRAVTLPGGAQLLAPPPPGSSERVVFETVRNLTATSAVLISIAASSGRAIERRTAAELVAGAVLEPFGRRPAPGNAVWLGFAGGAVPEELSLGFELLAGDRLAVRSGPTQAQPVVVWEAITDDGLVGAAVADDSTGGLQHSGLITLRIPRGWTAVPRADLDISNEPRRWLRARLVFGAYSRPPELTRVLVNAVEAEAVQTRREEVLEPIVDPLTPGRPSFRLSTTPVVAGSVRLAVQGSNVADPFDVMADAGPTLWEARESLAESGPDDRHFVVDVDTGDILFGDGVHGARPPSGFRNVQALQYQVPSGASSRVEANTQFTVVDNVAFLRAVTNPSAASGAYDADPVDKLDSDSDRALAAYGAGLHRAKGQAVVAADYEVLARALPSGGVTRAIACSGRAADGGRRTGAVTIVVIGRPRSAGDQPMPDEATLESVVRLLAPVAPPGVSLAAVAPVFVPVNVRVLVRRREDEPAATLVSYVAAALDAYLDPVTGGEDGRGWGLGDPILHRRLVNAVASYEPLAARGDRPGLRLVEALAVTVNGRQFTDCSDAPLSWNGLPWPHGHDIVPMSDAS